MISLKESLPEQSSELRGFPQSQRFDPAERGSGDLSRAGHRFLSERVSHARCRDRSGEECFDSFGYLTIEKIPTEMPVLHSDCLCIHPTGLFFEVSYLKRLRDLKVPSLFDTIVFRSLLSDSKVEKGRADVLVDDCDYSLFIFMR